MVHEVTPMPSKYDPLTKYLSNLSAGTPNPLTLTLAEIEDILGCSLPESAYEYEQWWGNETNPNRVHARSWQDAGYKVVEVNLSGTSPSVVFQK